MIAVKKILLYILLNLISGVAKGEYLRFHHLVIVLIKAEKIGKEAYRKQGEIDGHVQQRFLARLEPVMLQICGIHSNHMATRALLL